MHPTANTAAGIKVLIADDHEIIRQGLRLLFSGRTDLELVGEAVNGRQAIALAEQLHPDVVIMDVTMPELDGFEATHQIMDERPATKVIALSMHNDQVFVEGMKHAGAVGYILKDAAFEFLTAAILAVMRGETFFPG